MPITSIRAIANCDEVTIVWRAKPLEDCRGFALQRRVQGSSTTTYVPTWVGFRGTKHKPGESQPSTVWPIQRYIWSDYGAPADKKVQYRAVPMIGDAGALNPSPQAEWSAWSNSVALATGQTAGFDAYFNRGIVPAQWLAHQDPTKKSLQADIEDAKSKNRIFLSGPLRVALLNLLSQAKKDDVEVYAALYELNDPELIAELKDIGGKCNLVLGSGAYKAAKKGKPAEPDENAKVREDLRLHSSVNVHDRLVKSPHFAHNKFVVVCDKSGKPATLWTGSTNWTVTGLCTQVNNGILIDSAPLAAAFRARWDELKDAGAQYPASLAEAGTTPAKVRVGSAAVTAWNDPCLKTVDLADANRYIKAAQQGVLFLMFNPGPKNTLLNTILGLNANKLYIHGVVNQDPGGKKAPLIIKPVHKGTALPPMTAILPAALQNKGNWFDKEFDFSRVMIHSKVIVVDPFGAKPVVMTGSSNMGPKASGKNDDNLVIIANAPGLAAEYAVNIMSVYGHYKWLYNLSLKSKKGDKAATNVSRQYDGLYDDDKWQDWYTKGADLREIEFWLGKR
ncbi:MAG TPA: phospholipase D-like domain-containing protein [Stellaceae bacterium]|nr:phospholipase D-like domain-containing protein [Stellaceae bacterium]